MHRERRPSDRPRREILCADLDRLDHARRLWQADADASAARDRRGEAVRAAVATALTDKQRQVVEAYFFEGLSQGEIARRLGITQQVVQKRLYGAPRGGRLVGGAIPRLRTVLAHLLVVDKFASARPPCPLHNAQKRASRSRQGSPTTANLTTTPLLAHG